MEENNNSENVVIDEAVCETDNREGAIANQGPVYSKETLDYIAAQTKKAKRKGFLQGFIFSFVLLLFGCVVYLGVSVVRMISDGSLYAKTLGTVGSTILDKETIDKINSLYKIIGNTYIEEVDPQTIRDGMYKGMLEALGDPYSVYYTEDEFKEMMESSSGTFEGIGAYLSQDPSTMAITVVRPIKDSPAEAAGILADDILVEVDGEDITGQDLNLVVSKVRGPQGTKVNIGVVRAGESEILHFDVERDKINEVSVEYEMKDSKIGYILISEFADATGDQFKEAMDELEKEGMQSLIIDLRSNGGGYVDVSVDIADRILKGGVIVSIKDRHNIGHSYEDNGDEKFIDIPCVVLVDGNTASASEILTGALQDYEFATVIGTKTFGKGIVQDVLPLGDGSGMKITSSKYYTPNGVNIHGVGIEPDIVVEWDRDRYVNEGVDNQLEAAINYLTKGTVE